MSQDLRILISAGINYGKTVGQINKDIKALQKAVNKLHLDIKLDPKVLTTLKEFSSQLKRMNDQALSAGKAIEQVKLPDGTKITRTHFEGIGKSFSEIVEQSKAVKTSMQQTSGIISNTDKAVNQQSKSASQLAAEIGNVTKEVKLFNAEQEKLGSKITTQNKNGSISRTIHTDGQGNVTNYTDTRDFLRDEKEKNDLIEQMAQGRERAEIARRQRESQWNEAQRRAINSNIELERRRTTELSHQLKLFKDQQAIRVQELGRRYEGVIDSKALNDHLKQVQAMQPEFGKTQRQMKEFSVGLRQIEANAKTSAAALDLNNKSAISLANSFSTAITKSVVWAGAMTAIYAPLRMLKSSIDEILNVDSQLTVLKRVTSGQIEVNKVLEESFRLADALGNKMTEVNEAMIGFARQGYRGEDLSYLAEVSTLMQNVSSLSGEEAMSNLTAAVKVFNMEASDSIQILDALNEVDKIIVPYVSNGIRKLRICWKTLRVNYSNLIWKHNRYLKIN